MCSDLSKVIFEHLPGAFKTSLAMHLFRRRKVEVFSEVFLKSLDVLRFLIYCFFGNVAFIACNNIYD